ncbi:hypothetical protein BDP27DRAFT_1333365 [Rhodocollybia butyracea]|uniref:Malic enzyme n=1 Tax=Rhodocollybia butyracea TaxID=206335 RepID=A0A9P5PJS8_9AGAR|nr:hypothetical protein BDP27DRAFT_1333365 [Rhodocollybia butyracea]
MANTLQTVRKSILTHSQSQSVRVALRGAAILNQPRFNKGTAFTAKEREIFGLRGRLPSRVNSLDEQCERAYAQLKTRDTPIRMNTFLHSMKDQNWVLYYSLVAKHLKELLPIIYTPTQGEAIAEYSHLFRRSEGIYLTFNAADKMEEDFLEQTRGRDIDLIVCSDAEAILGIGDQGVGVRAICTAKSALYSLIGGMDPARCLPISLDVGTDNQKLLEDPLYVGWQHKRVRGQEYDEFVDKFVQLVRKHYPHSLLHFEDFGVTNAYKILSRYKESHAVFNDDIQGTGAVTLACTMAAIGVTRTKLPDQRIVVFGAGSAGMGITKQLRDAMVATDGISEQEANSKFYLIDRYGLITERVEHTHGVRDDVKAYVRPDSEWTGVAHDANAEISLLEVIKKIKPTVLIGCSTRPGAFTKEAIEAMAEGCERPIIFPLSNPDRLVEVTPADANEWTKGKALLATGSPFPPAKMPNGKDYIIAECNNALIYPGLGFGAILSKSRHLSESMIVAGARRLAALSPALEDPDNALLPDLGHAPAVNFEVAVAVAEQAIEEGSAGVDWTKEEVRERAKAKTWVPVYPDLVYDEAGMK